MVHSADEFVHVSIYERPQSLKEFQDLSKEDQEKYKQALRDSASSILESGPIVAESLIVIGWA